MASNNEFQKAVGLTRQIIKTVKHMNFAKHLDNHTDYIMCCPLSVVKI
jgi:hypothetical protein